VGRDRQDVEACHDRHHDLYQRCAGWDGLDGGKQVHDATIVATMRAHGATRRLTFNAADFRRFAPLIEVVAP